MWPDFMFQPEGLLTSQQRYCRDILLAASRENLEPRRESFFARPQSLPVNVFDPWKAMKGHDDLIFASVFNTDVPDSPLTVEQRAMLDDAREKFYKQSTPNPPTISRFHSDVLDDLPARNPPNVSRFHSDVLDDLPADAATGVDNSECIICSAPIATKPSCQLLCCHVFHVDCINKLASGSSRMCPICRQPYVPITTGVDMYNLL
jgi:hypothetical protein